MVSTTLTPSNWTSKLPVLVYHFRNAHNPTTPMSTTPETPPPAAAPQKEDTTVALLSYLTIIGFVVAIVLHSSKKTALGAFHLRQTLGLFITALVIWIPCMIISMIPVVNLVMFLLGPAVMIGLFVLWIMGFIAAINGQQKLLPVVGAHYQKWFANAFN
jgi:uncharacterized membrane protein